MYTSSVHLIGSVVLNANCKLKYGKKGLFWGTVSTLMKIIDFLIGAFQTFRVAFSALQFAEKDFFFSVCIVV